MWRLCGPLKSGGWRHWWAVCPYQADLTFDRLENRTLESSFGAYDAELKKVELIRHRVDNALDAACARIGRGRNWVCRVNRLPVETLCDIFQLAGESGFDHFTNRAIASTCTLWRTVTLNDPRMWTCLDIPWWRDYWAHILERSKQLPLSVRIRCRGDVKSGMAVLMEENNVSRIQRLAITTYKQHASLELDAPHLENLTVDVQSSATTSPLASCNLPVLRRLDLSGCYFPWLTGKYKNLTCIKIQHLGKAPRDIDPSWDFGVMLRESPELESIDLVFAMYSPRWSSFITAWHPRGSRLLMHRLGRLSLDMQANAAMHILRSLVMPQLKNINIVAHFGPDNASAVEALCSPEYFPASMFANMRKLAIVQAPRDAMLLGITTDRECIGDAMMVSYDEPQDCDVDIMVQLRYWDSSRYHTFYPLLNIIKDISMPLLNYTGVLRTTWEHVREAPWLAADIDGVVSFLLLHPTISSFTLDCHTSDFATGFVNALFRSINERPLSGPSAFFPSLARCRLALRIIDLQEATQFIPLIRSLLSNDRLDMLLVDESDVFATRGERDELQLLQRTNANRMTMPRYRSRSTY